MPSAFVRLDEGVQRVIGGRHFSGSSPTKNDASKYSIRLPLKPLNWAPTSSGFTLSLWLKLSRQFFLMYSQPEWLENVSPSSSIDMGSVKDSSPLEEKQIRVLSFGPDHNSLCVDAEIVPDKNTVLLYCR